MDDIDKIKDVISLGSDIAGVATGGALGFITGGPGGAALGGASGVVIARGLSDVVNRILSKREKIRIGATASFALEKIRVRLNSGEKLRNDGFFDEKEKVRSDAEEIFEGVLLKAKNEHEEKKAEILGNIFVNTAFSSDLSAGEANHVLRVAESLTYRQMCILSLIKRKNEIGNVELRRSYYDNEEHIDSGIPYETISVLQETIDICSLGLFNLKFQNEEGMYEIMGSWDSVAPDRLEFTPMGERYYQVLGLDDISEEDVREVASFLR